MEETKTFDADAFLIDLFTMKRSEVEEMFWKEIGEKNPHLEKIEVIIESGLMDVNAKTNGGWTPLHEACANNALECAELLLDRGADVNAKRNNGEIPLHWACRDDDALETTKLLLDRGADVNAKDNDNGGTPLHWACRYNVLEIAKLLLENGADAWAETKKNKIPYDYAKVKMKLLLREYMKK